MANKFYNGFLAMVLVLVCPSFHESWFWCPLFFLFLLLPVNFRCLFSFPDQTTSNLYQTYIKPFFFWVGYRPCNKPIAAGWLETRRNGPCDQCSWGSAIWLTCSTNVYGNMEVSLGLPLVTIFTRISQTIHFGVPSFTETPIYSCKPYDILWNMFLQ